MPLIRKARVNDLKGIYNVVRSVFITNKNKTSNGFLRGRHSRKFYTYYINNSKFFYVAVSGSDIVGFLFAYPTRIMKPKDERCRYLIKKFGDKGYIYISQIGILPKYQRQHIGKKLYMQLFRHSSAPLITTIALKPRNIQSERFHAKLGFKKIDTINTHDNSSSLIYERKTSS